MIYLICPVRNGAAHLSELANYVQGLERLGHTVHFPPRDVSQDDLTGANICAAHREAMQKANEVHVVWDVTSFGSHFDLGMAYALGKRIVAVDRIHPDAPGKSYWKAVVHPADYPTAP